MCPIMCCVRPLAYEAPLLNNPVYRLNSRALANLSPIRLGRVSHLVVTQRAPGVAGSAPLR